MLIVWRKDVGKGEKRSEIRGKEMKLSEANERKASIYLVDKPVNPC